MPDYLPTSPHDFDPQHALGVISAFAGPVMVDLDETLFLRNSTEEFISCAVPGLLALLMLRVLDVLKPWRWSGGHATRDVWRVRCICLFFPWTQVVWKRRVASLARKYINQPLANALASGGQQPIIVTVGFTPVVTPLVQALGFGSSRLVSARLDTFRDRRDGKLVLARGALGEETISRSMLVTDSTDDLPLLAKCAKPLRVIWPEARYRTALGSVYLPGRYITHVKHPGERHIFRSVLQEDYAFWVLSSIALAAQPLMHVASLALLLASFWAIYERGYVDNDYVAAHFEAAPKLSASYWETPVATPAVQPWIWAFALGALGILLLRYPHVPVAADFIKWSAVLVGTYAWFKLYNRYDKSTRIWMFGLLQFLRGAAFLVLIPATHIGIAAIGAHVLARWVPYFVYRMGGKAWPNGHGQTLRLLFFVLLAALFGLTLGAESVLNWSAAALLAWNIFRARRELPLIFRGAVRIDKEASAPHKQAVASGGAPK
jgi:hypothetical protein